MGFFDFTKNKKLSDSEFISQSLALRDLLPNKDLLYISDLPAQDIPRFGPSIVIEIVFKDGTPTIVKNEKLDPSTIFKVLPVSKPISLDAVPPMPYWPSYAGMSPEQRFKYLTWLYDVTNPTDMGYVFVYYYGLERQLLFGNFEKAFEEIIKLRNFHTNKSFLTYSETALIFASFYKNRLDLLLKNSEKTLIHRFSNIQLEFAIKNDLNLSFQNVISIFKELKLYSSALKGYENLFEKSVIKTLESEYKTEYFPLGKSFDLSKTKLKKEVAFANYSFPEELRYPDVSDILHSKDFSAGISKIYKYAYEDFKKEKSIEKKAEKMNLSDEEKSSMLQKKEMARLKKLYDNNILKREEYELLVARIEKHSITENGKNNNQ
jgi:TerB N-terminal domain